MEGICWWRHAHYARGICPDCPNILPSLAPNWLLLYNDLFNWSVRFKCQNAEFNWKYLNQPQILEINAGINVKYWTNCMDC